MGKFCACCPELRTKRRFSLESSAMHATLIMVFCTENLTGRPHASPSPPNRPKASSDLFFVIYNRAKSLFQWVVASHSGRLHSLPIEIFWRQHRVCNDRWPPSSDEWFNPVFRAPSQNRPRNRRSLGRSSMRPPSGAPQSNAVRSRGPFL